MALYTIIVYVPNNVGALEEGWRLLGHSENDEKFCRDYIWKTPGPANKKAKTWNDLWNKEGYFYEVIEL